LKRLKGLKVEGLKRLKVEEVEGVERLRLGWRGDLTGRFRICATVIRLVFQYKEGVSKG